MLIFFHNKPKLLSIRTSRQLMPIWARRIVLLVWNSFEYANYATKLDLDAIQNCRRVLHEVQAMNTTNKAARMSYSPTHHTRDISSEC